MAQQFRAIAAPTDDLGLIAKTHKVAQNYPDSSFRKSSHPLLRASGVHVVHIHPCRLSYM